MAIWFQANWKMETFFWGPLNRETATIFYNAINSYLHTAEIFPRKAVFRSFFKFLMEENPIEPPFPGLIFHGEFKLLSNDPFRNDPFRNKCPFRNTFSAIWIPLRKGSTGPFSQRFFCCCEMGHDNFLSSKCNYFYTEFKIFRDSRTVFLGPTC